MLRNPRVAILAMAPLAAFLAGCTTDVEQAPLTEASTSEVAAVVSLESTSYAYEEAQPHATTVARFIRTREGAVDAPTLAMLGADLELPPLGSCAASTPSPCSEEGGAREVELVDFGAVSLDSGERATSLTERRVPDVTDLISGVVYAARLEGNDAPLAGPLSIQVDGANRSEPFSIDIGDVHAPDDVAFDGLSFDRTTPLSFSMTLDLVVTWTPVPGDDVVYFEIEGGGGEAATCAYADLGTATLPSALFARAGGVLTIHRLHRETVSARGIDEGEARFDFSRVYAFQPDLATADLSP